MRNQSIDGAVQLGVLLLLVMLLLAAYLIARGTHTIGTTYVQHPGHKGLIAAGLAAVLAALGAAWTVGNPIFLAVAAAGALSLWFIARVVQLQDDSLLQRPWSLDEVVHPGYWWNAA